MNRCISILASTLLVGSLAAQTYESAPKGYLSASLKPGETSSTLLGAYANGRMQFANGELKGNKIAISHVYFRLDRGRFYSTNLGMGRTWQQVQLYLGETDLAKMKNDWSNYSGAATNVYKSSWTFGSKTGTEANGEWGVTVPKLTLSAPFAYSGNGDLLMDFLFHSGTLANKATWGTSWSNYVLDNATSSIPTYASATSVSLPATTTCNDGALTHTVGASIYYSGTLYADDYPTTSLQGRYTVYHFTRHTAPNSLVIQAASVLGSATGVDIGAQCNRLYPDLSGAIGYTYRTADSSGYSSYATNNGYYNVPFNKAWAGAVLWYQGAWEDTVTRRISLTRGLKVTLPKPPARQKRAVLYSPDRLAKTGTLSTYSYYQAFPLFCYK